MGTLRRARKAHRCSEQSYHKILPGDLYLYDACPPWHEMNRTHKGEKRWEYIRACLRCAKEYGMLDSDQRKVVENGRRDEGCGRQGGDLSNRSVS